MDRNLKHSEWRKMAKKIRRKRIRKKTALKRIARENVIKSTPAYQELLAKEDLLETIRLDEERRISEENHKKWLKIEEETQKAWTERKRIERLAAEEKQKELERIKAEWDAKQNEIEKQKEKEKKLMEEEEKRRREFLAKIDEFIVRGGDIPQELLTVRETQPGLPLCHFFQKVGACRFKNSCSRNHVHTGISKQLMFPGFYSHFSLVPSYHSEYDTDISLEYEDSDMYNDFKEFYNDIVPELQSHGKVVILRVCCNLEPHLRGNVYVEYDTEREALLVYKKFQGRWYGGKQLAVKFINIPNWGAAICGDFIRRHCPKGRSCNFLHTFRNPRNEFPLTFVRKTNSQRTSRDSSVSGDSLKRHWRWSESPESDKNGSEKRSRRDTKYKESNTEHRSSRKENSEETSRHNRSNGSRRRHSRSGHSYKTSRTCSTSRSTHKTYEKRCSRSRDKSSKKVAEVSKTRCDTDKLSRRSLSDFEENIEKSNRNQSKRNAGQDKTDSVKLDGK